MPWSHEEVKKELDEEKIPYKDVELGIMIETPAAVMMSEPSSARASP